MKLKHALFSFIALTSLSMFSLADTQKTVSAALNDYAWEKRQLIVFSENEENNEYQKFKQVLKESHTDITERKLHTWHIIGDQPVFLNETKRDDVNNQAFRDRYNVKNHEFRLILIGYDQGEKQRQEAVSMERLFSAIDSMPMRIREMESEMRMKSKSLQ